MNDNEKDMFRRTASHLLREAADLIDHGNPDKALWRAVDAAGMLADVLAAWKKRDCIGAGMPTGRGYRITNAADDDVVVKRVR